MGTWETGSRKDPRWNKSGRGKGLISSGGPTEMSNWIKECKEEFGEPPDDLYVLFFKD
jgi:hypothetical protein